MAQTVAVNRSKYEDKQPLKQPLNASDGPPSKRGRQAPKPVRGVFEHPPDSGIWWVNYYVDGKRHREKVGTRKAASDLYSKRKNDARMGLKLPDSLKAKRAILFEELARDAMEYSKAHKKSHRGDISNLSSLLPVFGKLKAEEITPQTISTYFSTRTDLKPASINRYRSTMSMIFAEGTPVVCGDTPDCIVTETTVKGYADVEKTSIRIEYVLTCDQVMTTKEPPHLAISCGSIHANNDYHGRVFDNAISFWPVEKHTPPPQWGLYSIVSEKEFSR